MSSTGFCKEISTYRQKLLSVRYPAVLTSTVRALREDENFAASRNPCSGLQCSLIFFTHFKTFLKSGFEGPTALVDSCSKMWLLIRQSSNLSSLMCIKALLLSPLLRFAFCPSGSWLKKPGRSRAPTALAAVQADADIPQTNPQGVENRFWQWRGQRSVAGKCR